jgi:hypothetical protein
VARRPLALSAVPRCALPATSQYLPVIKQTNWRREPGILEAGKQATMKGLTGAQVETVHANEGLRNDFLQNESHEQPRTGQPEIELTPPPKKHSSWLKQQMALSGYTRCVWLLSSTMPVSPKPENSDMHARSHGLVDARWPMHGRPATQTTSLNRVALRAIVRHGEVGGAHKRQPKGTVKMSTRRAQATNTTVGDRAPLRDE